VRDDCPQAAPHGRFAEQAHAFDALGARLEAILAENTAEH
jgi:hypothetical protein